VFQAFGETSLDWSNTACYSAPLDHRLSEFTHQQDDTMEREDAILNSKEVARILDLSPDTVNEFARKSVLPGFKKGRQWRFRRRDIASFKRQLRGATAA
jgi:excisionase family DNA binding protein